MTSDPNRKLSNLCNGIAESYASASDEELLEESVSDARGSAERAREVLNKALSEAKDHVHGDERIWCLDD